MIKYNKRIMTKQVESYRYKRENFSLILIILSPFIISKFTHFLESIKQKKRNRN